MKRARAGKTRLARPARRARGALYAAGSLAVALAVLLGAWFASGWSDVRRQQGEVRGEPARAAERKSAELAMELRGELTRLVGREVERPYFHYQNLMHDPRSGANFGVTPSPLATGTGDPLVLGYFQLDDTGRVTTPTINDEIPMMSEPRRLAENRWFRDEVLRNMSRSLTPHATDRVLVASSSRVPRVPPAGPDDEVEEPAQPQYDYIYPPTPAAAAPGPAAPRPEVVASAATTPELQEPPQQRAQVITIDPSSYQQNSIPNEVYWTQNAASPQLQQQRRTAQPQRATPPLGNTEQVRNFDGARTPLEQVRTQERAPQQQIRPPTRAPQQPSPQAQQPLAPPLPRAQTQQPAAPPQAQQPPQPAESQQPTAPPQAPQAQQPLTSAPSRAQPQQARAQPQQPDPAPEQQALPSPQARVEAQQAVPPPETQPAAAAQPAPSASRAPVRKPIRVLRPKPPKPPKKVEVKVKPPPEPILITVSPLEWRTYTFEGRPGLVAVRHVETPDGMLAQGFVIDRTQLTSWLATHAGDNVAELRYAAPTTGEAVVGPEDATSKSMTAAATEIAAGWHLDVAANPRSLVQASSDAADVARGFVFKFVAVGVIAMMAAAFVVFLVANAERLARERSQFAAAAAHELRTPLAGLQLYGDMLADGLGDPGKLRDYARRMSEEASRLGRVVSNVLGFSQLERGNLSVEARDGELGAALCELADRATPALDRAGAVLDLDVPPDLRGRFDHDALARIVGNLLDNAEKYSRDAEDRTITLAARATGDAVEVIVSDRGPGISPQARAKLFRAFSRGVTTDGPAGLGLGLALSQSLARAMGGELSYRPSTEGASFVLRLEPSSSTAPRERPSS
ncbi:MAG: HAMP domain-containing histidine kinase [Deltaproteobacteria bacterium]|nr:HAMP domain-containing histidine kinase [Deltaproteobacteria bacterium]